MPPVSSGNSGSDGLIPPEPSEAVPVGRTGQARQAWRNWRYTRPFWGGLLVTLAGAEILLSEKGPLPLIIHIGFQGLAGYLIPAVMVLCGLLLLFHPVQRTFYSALAVLLALGSWITSNLGGFFVGMLLGVFGGSLAFAWQEHGRYRLGKRRHRPRPQAQPSAGLALIRGDPPAEPRLAGPPASGDRAGPAPAAPGQEQPGTGRPASSFGTGASPPGTSAILAIPLAPLALSMLIAAALARPASSAPSMAFAARPSPSPVASSHTPRPTASATPSQTPTPSASATVTPTPQPSPSPTPSPQPTRPRAHHAPVAGAPALDASAEESRLIAGSAVLTGLDFDGVARVPTTTGEVRMLKLSMSSLTLSGGTMLLIGQQGGAFVTRGPSLLFSGDVVLYATRISGTLDGTRIAFTPGRPPSRRYGDTTLSGVVADRPYATADSLRVTGFQITERPAGSPRAGG